MSLNIRHDAKYGVYRWRRQFRLDDGSVKRISGTAPTKTEARRDMERARQKAISLSRAPAPPKVVKTFEEFAETWLDTFPASRNNRPTTIQSKTYHVRKRLIPYFRELAFTTPEARERGFLLSQITSKVIDRMAADMSASGRLDGGEKPLAPRTVALVLQTLRRILRSAVSWGELDSMPEFPSVKVPKAKFDFLTFEEAERLLANSGPEAWNAYALILTAIRTGPRAGELLGLTWDRVHFERNTIQYDRQLIPGYRSGEEPKLVDVKTGPREVPMSLQLSDALQELRARRVVAGSDFVFVGPLSGRPFSRAYLKTVVEGALQTAGLRVVHPHALRHTFASHCAMRGLPMQRLQKWLGHSSITMTMRYAHLAPDASDKLLNVLDSPPAPTKKG